MPRLALVAPVKAPIEIVRRANQAHVRKRLREIPQRLAARTEALATEMASTSRTSNGAVKRLLLGTYRTGLEEQMELEGRYLAGCARSEDGQEGIAAFLAKRKPEFA